MAAVSAALDMAEIMNAKKEIPAFLDWIDKASMVSDNWIAARQVMDRWQRSIHLFGDLGEVAKILNARPQPQQIRVPLVKNEKGNDFALGLRSYQLSTLSEGALGAKAATEAIQKSIEDSNAHPAYLDAAIDQLRDSLQKYIDEGAAIILE